MKTVLHVTTAVAVVWFLWRVGYWMFTGAWNEPGDVKAEEESCDDWTLE